LGNKRQSRKLSVMLAEELEEDISFLMESGTPAGQ
jgi:hypothetical protein